MSEPEFTFRRQQDEEPLFLDSERGGASKAASSGLYLDRAAERPARRGRRSRLPLIVASILTFLAAAGAAAVFLEPPAPVRDFVQSFLGRNETPATASAPTAGPAVVKEVETPPIDPVPTVEEAAAAAEREAAAAEAAEPPRTEAAPPPRVEPAQAPKPEAAVREPEKATAPQPKKPAATKKASPKPAVAKKTPAKKPPAKAPSLDLDALERSLPSDAP